MAKPRFYVTTAISYPNGAPHIGHAYEVIATDAIARFMRADGRDVFFLTGTDEHGLKMVQTAEREGLTARALADRNSDRFRAMAQALAISNDDFIRTTEPRHYRASQAIWDRMVAAGDIYLGAYEGWYSVRDEAFYGEEETSVGADGVRVGGQGTPVEWTKEETYFFRLSKYQDKLLAHYQAHPDFVGPDTRFNEVISFVKGGLADLSVSRTTFDWGVPVPGADGHVMYVWVDALTNYLTATGFPDESDPKWPFWPADLHVIGKDIVRFHAVYWPAFLMSAGIDLPKRVYGHGFLFNRGEKMSKSLGNVADPLELAEAFGVDQLRYFLLSEVTFGNDGSYSAEAIVTRCNADLANSFGNLAQRTLSFIAKNLGALPDCGRGEPADADLLALIAQITRKDVPTAFADLGLSQGIEAWLRGVFACNQYIDAQAPWALRKSDPDRMMAVLATLYRVIRDLAIVITPVIPAAAAKLLDQMGAEARDFAALEDDGWYGALVASGFELALPSPIFPRLELPAEA